MGIEFEDLPPLVQAQVRGLEDEWEKLDAVFVSKFSGMIFSLLLLKLLSAERHAVLVGKMAARFRAMAEQLEQQIQ